LEFNAGAPTIGIGRPSDGNGMLFVATGQTFTIAQTRVEASSHSVCRRRRRHPPKPNGGGLQIII